HSGSPRDTQFRDDGPVAGGTSCREINGDSSASYHPRTFFTRFGHVLLHAKAHLEARIGGRRRAHLRSVCGAASTQLSCRLEICWHDRRSVPRGGVAVSAPHAVVDVTVAHAPRCSHAHDFASADCAAGSGQRSARSRQRPTSAGQRSTGSGQRPAGSRQDVAACVLCSVAVAVTITISTIAVTHRGRACNESECCEGEERYFFHGVRQAPRRDTRAPPPRALLMCDTVVSYGEALPQSS